ncbi:hypothetical protein TNCT_252601 [Trichonephila clavata]|uniref:Uncharacterized protein n=1 Tax=Trichonephila clavata TaxID=2740835 RepID=A0A8X6LBP2_TRICU|nr:hypothetical protein TNCT_252601 [Trichonephila clavata]
MEVVVPAERSHVTVTIESSFKTLRDLYSASLLDLLPAADWCRKIVDNIVDHYSVISRVLHGSAWFTHGHGLFIGVYGSDLVLTETCHAEEANT